jgi:hypothetical protein
LDIAENTEKTDPMIGRDGADGRGDAAENWDRSVMAKGSVYLKFVENGVTGIIEPYWDNAPKTCSILWEALAKPVQMPAMHAMFAGPEIMLGLPPEAQVFDPTAMPAENQTCFPVAGDCLWFYQGPNLMKGLTDELWEIGMFYDDGGRIFGPLGWTPCTIWGRMTEGLDAIAACCRAIRVDGLKTVEIGRLA